MKLDKYIAASGYTSRRKALQLIEQKVVRVNGKRANVFTPVSANDKVSIHGQTIGMPQKHAVVIMYHKPKGIVCTSEKIDGNIIDAVNHPQQIFPIGRLDKDSEGLILLTNQSELIDKIANPSGNHEKEYLVTLNHPLRKQFLDDLSKGIKIGNQTTKPCLAVQEPNTKRIMRITITQGLNRQIRKMCNAYQYQVIKLQRVRVMNIQLGRLKPGEWRDLSTEELTDLKNQLGMQAPNKTAATPEAKTLTPKKGPDMPPAELLKPTPAKHHHADEPSTKATKAPRLKKHEIKAKQKAPWEKMHAASEKNKAQGKKLQTRGSQNRKLK